MSKKCLHECPYKEHIHGIKTDIKDIKVDVKSLLKFKWQLMAGAGTIGVAISAILSYFKLIGKY